MITCHQQGGHQFWALTPAGEVRRDEACLDHDGGLGPPVPFPCHGLGGNQVWRWEEFREGGRIIHDPSGKCLSVWKDQRQVELLQCQEDDPDEKQIWQWTWLRGKGNM